MKIFLQVLFFISFLSLSLAVQGQHKTIQGKITFISKLPQPKDINYPNCNFSTVLELSHEKKSLSKKINLVFLGIKNKKLIGKSTFKVGEKLQVTIIPFEAASSNIRETQLVDEVDDFDLPVFYAVSYKKIKNYNNSRAALSIKQKKKEEKIIVLPREKRAVKLREKIVKKDLKRLKKLLKKNGRSFTKWFKDTQKYRDDYKGLYKSKEHKWIGDSYFSAGQAFLDEEEREGNFVEAMIDFQEYLNQFNIDLIVVRVPFKGEVSADLFLEDAPKDKILDPYVYKISKELLENNIECIDIVPRLLEERFNFPLTYFYNDFNEMHPAEPVSWLIADEVSKRLERYSFKQKDVDFKKVGKFNIARNGKKYRWPKGNAKFSPKEYVNYKSVDYIGLNKKFKIKDNTDSEVLFVGNSFSAYPANKYNASVPHYFYYLSGIKPDYFLRSGASGFGRLVFKKGTKFLEGKKVLIYIVYPNHFQGNVATIPLENRVSFKNYLTSDIEIFNTKNWNALDFSTKVDSSFVKNRTEFVFNNKGLLQCYTKKNKKTGRGEGGEIKIPIKDSMNSADFFKINLEFASTAFGNISVKYGDDEKFLIRTINHKDSKTEVVYFKNTKKDKFITLSFPHTRNNSPQKIKSITVSALTKQ